MPNLFLKWIWTVHLNCTSNIIILSPITDNFTTYHYSKISLAYPPGFRAGLRYPAQTSESRVSLLQLPEVLPHVHPGIDQYHPLQ